MKKIIFTLIIFIFIFVGCKKESNIKIENFENENYINFIQFKNLVKFLNLDTEKIVKFSDDENKLAFGFYYENSNEIPKIYDYLLEKNFLASILDGTINSSYIFENKNYKLSIIIFSDLEEYKKNNYDNIENINKLSENENSIFIIEKIN